MSNNKLIVYLFLIWDLRTHKTQEIFPIINIANDSLDFVTFQKNEHGGNSRITQCKCNT